MFLLISELDHVLVSEATEVVHFDDGLEDWESVLDVSEVVISVDVDAVDLDFVTRAGDVDKIVQDEDLFLARDTARRDCAWSLLDRELLIVAIDRLGFLDGVGASCLAHDTLGE